MNSFFHPALLILLCLNVHSYGRLNQAMAEGTIQVDFPFEDAEETKLTETQNVAGDQSWSVSLRDCDVALGSFRIERNKTDSATTYLPLPRPEKKDDDSKTYLIVKLRGWNFTGKTTNEMVRFGFTSQIDKRYQTAAMVLQRTAADEVTLSGVGFGDGSSDIGTVTTFLAHEPKPITLVLELDKSKNNTGTGDVGGIYQIYYRRHSDSQFKKASETGITRRTRNGNAIHLRCAGYFGYKNEYFDIDRLYVSSDPPSQSE